MSVTAIDHAIVATNDLEAAAEPWRRLGFTPVHGGRHSGQGTENAAVFFGDSAESMFYLEFLAANDRAEASATTRGRLLVDAIDGAGGLFRIMLESEDLAAEQAQLESAGLECALATVSREDGSRIGDVLSTGGDSETSNDPRLISYASGRSERFESHRSRGVFTSTFPVSRLDHLALIPSDLEAMTALWTDSLGVSVCGEVRANGLVIQQMEVGDAIVEFLAPDGPESRVAGAEPGLRSMLAFEVDDLNASVEEARVRGFTPSEPAIGVLPGTRVATIPPGELSGAALQLLEYV